MLNVMIVGGDYNISTMFLKRGWNVVGPLADKIDLVQFTGGEDVDPSYYEEAKHPATYSNPARDAREAQVYHSLLSSKIPMAGICRGAQFLNVMNGGKMWQHITGHAVARGHMAIDLVSGEEVFVTSTHHQMMIPSALGQVLATANVAGHKYSYDNDEKGGINPDIEVVFYKETNSLCFQPHPEYVGIDNPCQRLYFDYLDQFLGLK